MPQRGHREQRRGKLGWITGNTAKQETKLSSFNLFAPYIASGLLNLHTALAGTLIPAIPGKKRVAFILD
ncbi:MAG: hypothetical protein K2N04_03335 [Alistipes sp.]|nr:hypothetical protein [Alistipes sp.]